MTLQEKFDKCDAVRAALKLRLETEEMSSATWQSVSNQYLGSNVRCNRLEKELRHEQSKAAYAKAVSA